MASPNNASTTVTMAGPQSVSANFTQVTGIAIQTSPTGLQFSVDGGPLQTAPQAMSLTPGTHSIAVAPIQSGGLTTQYVFTSWSDGGAATLVAERCLGMEADCGILVIEFDDGTGKDHSADRAVVGTADILDDERLVG